LQECTWRRRWRLQRNHLPPSDAQKELFDSIFAANPSFERRSLISLGFVLYARSFSLWRSGFWVKAARTPAIDFSFSVSLFIGPVRRPSVDTHYNFVFACASHKSTDSLFLFAHRRSDE
jgi:hypothetical protein